MMDEIKQSPKMKELLRLVSAKLGVSQEVLAKELASGKFDKALASMKPQEKANLQQILNNPQLLNQMMNSRQAKAIYEKFAK